MENIQLPIKEKSNLSNLKKDLKSYIINYLPLYEINFTIKFLSQKFYKIINSDKTYKEINDIIEYEMIDIDFTNKPEENLLNFFQNFPKLKNEENQKYLIEDLMVYFKLKSTEKENLLDFSRKKFNKNLIKIK